MDKSTKTILLIIGGAVLVLIIVNAILGSMLRSADNVGRELGGDVSCAVSQERVDDIMYQYLRTHNGIGSATKLQLRQRVDGLPACAAAVAADVRSWMDAVDADDSQAMHDYDERIILAIRRFND